MQVRQAHSQQTVLNLLRQLQQEIDAQDLHLELCRRDQKMGLAIVVIDCPIGEKLDCWFQSQEFRVYYHTLEVAWFMP